MYKVYLLKSTRDNQFYIGQTSDVFKRLEEHNQGRVKSTKSRCPFKLIGYESYKERNKARWREYELKHSPRKKKVFIETLIKKYNAEKN